MREPAGAPPGRGGPVTGRLRWVAAAALVLGGAACQGDRLSLDPTTTTSTAAPGGQALRFGVWGDTPYNDGEAALVARLVDEVNAADVAFTVHVGDVKDGDTPCDDAVYASTLETFGRFSAPLLYVPGDNEWSDCHRGGHDPLERLAHLRRAMYATDRSFGQRPLALQQQRPDYPEHSRWQVGAVVGIGLNVPGGNNNHVADPAAPEPNTSRTAAQRAAAEAEFRARDEAAVAWLGAGFDAATAAGAAAVVVVIQADPRFDVPAADRAARRVDGFDRLVSALAGHASRFAGPVVLVHGDTHQFRQDRPLVDPSTGAGVANVVRVETYGSPLVGWVEVTIDVEAAEPVRAEPHVVVGLGGP